VTAGAFDCAAELCTTADEVTCCCAVDGAAAAVVETCCCADEAELTAVVATCCCVVVVCAAADVVAAGEVFCVVVAGSALAWRGGKLRTAGESFRRGLRAYAWTLARVKNRTKARRKGGMIERAVRG
jgi:hypothetical protein